MPRYFKMAAIVVQQDEINVQQDQINLFRIPLRQELQQNLANNWNTQYSKFLDRMEELDFTLGYELERKQLFRLRSCELSDWLASQNVNTIPKLNSDNEEELIDLIQGIVAFTRDNNNEDILLFQNFTSSQVIRSNKLMFIQGHSYDELRRPALTLANNLSAVYLPKKEKLLFRSFRNVNTFLPLSDIYYEASEEDILEVLSHKLFECTDKEVLVNNSTQWIRKRFAMLKDSKNLGNYSVTQIEKKARECNVRIQVENDKIIFPTDKDEVKKLLQLLNEEIFQGPLTDEIYETNSKRKTGS